MGFEKESFVICITQKYLSFHQTILVDLNDCGSFCIIAQAHFDYFYFIVRQWVVRPIRKGECKKKLRMVYFIFYWTKLCYFIFIFFRYQLQAYNTQCAFAVSQCVLQYWANCYMNNDLASTHQIIVVVFDLRILLLFLVLCHYFDEAKKWWILCL